MGHWWQNTPWCHKKAIFSGKCGFTMITITICLYFMILADPSMHFGLCDWGIIMLRLEILQRTATQHWLVEVKVNVTLPCCFLCGRNNSIMHVGEPCIYLLKLSPLLCLDSLWLSALEYNGMNNSRNWRTNIITMATSTWETGICIIVTFSTPFMSLKY